MTDPTNSMRLTAVLLTAAVLGCADDTSDSVTVTAPLVRADDAMHDGGYVGAAPPATAPAGPTAAADAAGRDDAAAEPARAEPDAAPWPIFRGDRALRGVAPGELADELALRWTFDAGASIASSPVVGNGRAYFGADDGSVYAVDLATGEEAWSFATEDVVEAPPLLHDGAVFVGSADFHMYAIEADTGALRWKQETGDQVLGGASWIDTPDGVEGAPTAVIVGCYDNRLYCFDARSGARRWTYETENYVNGTPVVDGDRIIFGGCDANVHLLSASGEPIQKIPLCGECHIPGSVAYDDGAVYFGHHGNEVVCVDLATGDLRWRYGHPRHPFYSSPAVTDDRVIFGGRDKQLHCVRRDDGTPLWTVKARRKIDASPVVCGDKVVFGSVDGTLATVRLADGAAVWSYDVGQSLFSSPAVADGIVLVGCNDGRLYAFGE